VSTPAGTVLGMFEDVFHPGVSIDNMSEPEPMPGRDIPR
jgi:hypothetical protein